MRPFESYSSINTYRTCPRMYQLSRLAEIGDGGTSESAETGKEFHELWGRYHHGYECKPTTPVLAAMLKAYARKFDPIKGLKLCEWPLKADGYSFVPDMLVNVGDKEVDVYELKTTGGRDIWKTAEAHRSSGQLISYQHFLEKSFGMKVRKCVLEVVGVPSLKKSSRETEGEYVERMSLNREVLRWEMKFSEAEKLSWAVDTAETVAMMVLSASRGVWPRHTKNCNWMYGKECIYKKVCGT